MLLAKVMKGKSSMACIKTSNETTQLEVCHSAFAFHGFCHRGAELETIKQRITSPERICGTSVILLPSSFLQHAAGLEPSSCSRVWCFAPF